MDVLPREILYIIAEPLPLSDLISLCRSSSYCYRELSNDNFRKGWLLSHIPACFPRKLRNKYKGNFFLWCHDFAASVALVEELLGTVDEIPLRKITMRSFGSAMLYSACITGNVDLAGAIFWAYALFQMDTQNLLPYIRLLVLNKRFEEISDLCSMGIRPSSYFWDLSYIPEVYHHIFEYRRAEKISPFSIHKGRYSLDGPGPGVLLLQDVVSLVRSGEVGYAIHTSGYYSYEKMLEILGEEEAKLMLLMEGDNFFLRVEATRDLALNFLSAGDVSTYRILAPKFIEEIRTYPKKR